MSCINFTIHRYLQDRLGRRSYFERDDGRDEQWISIAISDLDLFDLCGDSGRGNLDLGEAARVLAIAARVGGGTYILAHVEDHDAFPLVDLHARTHPYGECNN